MEVHAHSHTPRKKWTHYLWEFLMLFLAVFCGFLAENQREHFIEHQREKVLARSLVEDLKKDSLQLQNAIFICNKKIADLRELVTLLHQPTDRRTDTMIYRKALLIQYATRILRSAGTYNQIVNSGALRYFPQEMVNLMNRYDVDIRMVESRRDADLEIIYNNSLPFINRILNQEVFDEILEGRPISKPTYIINSGQIHEFINYAIGSRRITERMKIESEIALTSAKLLMDALIKDYHK